MCGIFGVIAKEGSLRVNLAKKMANRLFNLSESRGKEASGIAIRTADSIYIYKQPIAPSAFIKSEKYNRLFNSLNKKTDIGGTSKIPLVILGHSRLVTNGQQELNQNNQPVIKDNAIGVHNGIIVNDGTLWKKFPKIAKMYDVDTEVFLSLIQMFDKEGCSLTDSARNTFRNIEGSVSAAVIFNNNNLSLLLTNTGSLYICTNSEGNVLLFASEKYILKKFTDDINFKKLFKYCEISQVEPGCGYIVDIYSLQKELFRFCDDIRKEAVLRKIELPKMKVIDCASDDIQKNRMPELISRRYSLRKEIKDTMSDTWRRVYSGSDILKRCKKCILPETMPFIESDKDGVCNYCKIYESRKVKKKGEHALREILSKYENKTGKAECLVAISGGRDSSFGLHYIKTRLGMRPVAFTYDWGVVTDLARRNQARLCSKLGVEHIIISADIRRKREYIRKNIEAWLKKPELGMVPLWMAGDKQFYDCAHKLRCQTGIKPVIFCAGNEFEEANFKLGFAGINDRFTQATLTHIPWFGKIKLAAYYGRQYLENLAYINSSILDTLHAYFCTFMLRDDYLYLYHYIDWDEKEILSTLIKEYNWEIATDTKSTWRIGDGTAPFYNYVYLAIAGFTEFDTFRSKQIREGKLTRKEAFEIVREDNKPRFESIEWYAQKIGFDCNRAITIINSVPKLYKL